MDTLNVTLQRMRVASLDGTAAEELNIGLTNQIFHSVKTESDWEGVALILAGRCGGVEGPSSNGQLDLQKLLQMLFR